MLRQELIKIREQEMIIDAKIQALTKLEGILEKEQLVNSLPPTENEMKNV